MIRASFLGLLLAIAPMLAADIADPARAVEERFLAPCCWRENLAVHRSPDAEAMRAEIRQLVSSGKTELEIIDHFVAKYGERILREPRGAVSVWLIVVPVVVLFGGAMLLVGFLMYTRRSLPAVTPAGVLTSFPEVDDEEIKFG